MIVGLSGLPFSGKGTLADFLVDNFNYTKVSLSALPAELADQNETIAATDNEETKGSEAAGPDEKVNSVDKI